VANSQMNKLWKVWNKEFFIPSKGPEDWRELLVNKIEEFKIGYSTKTLAYCWEEQQGFPKDVKSVFLESGIELFQNIELPLGLPEYKVPLPRRPQVQ
jgi:hypothetical protein